MRIEEDCCKNGYDSGSSIPQQPGQEAVEVPQRLTSSVALLVRFSPRTVQMLSANPATNGTNIHARPTCKRAKPDWQ
jgi:hypothetical protein